MASTIKVMTIPAGVQSMAWASIPVATLFLSTAGKLFFKIDDSTCLNVEQQTIDVAPASGYACDVQILAQYKRGV